MVNVGCEFSIQRRRLPSQKRSDQWKYLGVLYTAEERKKLSVADLMKGQLEKLTQAPLKPQQRLWALRAVVIPSLLYQLTLGDTSVGLLRKVDEKVRAAVRRWCHLPHECSNACLLASIVDDGLGIPSMWRHVLLDILGRLNLLKASMYIVGRVVDTFLDREIKAAAHWLNVESSILDKLEKVNTYNVYNKYKTCVTHTITVPIYYYESFS